LHGDGTFEPLGPPMTPIKLRPDGISVAFPLLVLRTRGDRARNLAARAWPAVSIRQAGEHPRRSHASAHENGGYCSRSRSRSESLNS
jgi:hypothetical protein